MAACETVCCDLRPLRAPIFVVVEQKLGPPMVPVVWTTPEGMAGSAERYVFPAPHSNGKSSAVVDESRHWIVYPGANLPAVLWLGRYADPHHEEEPSHDKLGRGIET